MSAGFISLKNNSTAVTGSGTDFKTDLAEGDFIIATVGGVTYTLPVKTITDATNLIMAREYNGPAQGNIAWTAMPRDTLNSISAQIAADTAYAIRSRILEINNWYQLLETNGDVTIKMADGSTYTGPSWLKICDLANASDLSKIQPLADQIHRDATQVAGDKTAADNSAKAASASASGAASSATAAKGSADTAGGSATAAAKSASDAAGSATAAKNSADTAGGSATAAAKSASDAAGSATAAKNSADTAGASATAAAKSAGDAAGSATAAKNSADTAGGSATAAAKSASDADGSATAAKHSADTAGSSATAAAGSASSAGTSETHAASSATSASQSADRAEAAARNASAGTVKTVNGKAPDDEGRITLGSAADADIVTSMTDTTAGRVPVVGWMGISKAIIIPANTNTDLAEFFKTAPGAFYHCDNATQYVNAPSWFGVTWFDVIATVHEATNYRTLYAISGSGNTAFAVISAGNFGGWKKDFTEVQKPTPADINAVNKTGDTMTGQLRINFDGESITLQPKTAGYASYLISNDSSGANQWYIGKGSVNNDDAVFNNYKGGNNSVTLKADGSVSIATANGKNVSITGQAVPSNYTNFDERYLKLTGGKITGNLEINDNAPIIQFSEADTGKKYFIVVDGSGFRIDEDSTAGNSILSYAGASKQMKTVGQFVPTDYTNFDNRYQAKGSYTPEGEAYTKAQSDARYQAKGSTPDLSGYMTTATANAKFVTATRQSADVSLTTSANATTVAPAGASMSGITLSTSGVTGGIHVLEMRHRTTQYCVNGTWLNAGKVSISAPVMVARRPREQEKITRITNFSQYSPGITDEVIEHDGQELHIESLISEEGYDWYEIQQLITGECFIAFDDDGVIWQISHDASYLTPDNLSVAGIDGTPDGCDIDGSWKYDGTIVYQDADIVAARVLAENDGMRNALVMQAATSIIVIQAGISCNRSLDGDTEALSAWQGYLCDLREMTEEELQQADVVFPEMPSPVF
ncbi:hypothetical protein M942_19920 [Enterobacter ludwigii]|uniref:tail fiber assembly protein n=1 Tax=Enterobacter ludwigii TaxID=299767 RepID=UPI0003D93658|nr:tail fiber assembly protein [Enterobacter ludwigii]AHE73315.1 hypothetical protein M942_19920 [Enterobacter ludwigii]